jgi:hypothetical protein
MDERYRHLQELEKDFKPHKAILNWKLKFGKHKGKTYEELFRDEKKYVNWMVASKIMHEKVLKCYELYKEIDDFENERDIFDENGEVRVDENCLWLKTLEITKKLKEQNNIE